MFNRPSVAGAVLQSPLSIKGRGYWHTLCVPVGDYWHTPPEIEPMKARVCANCSFLLLAHTQRIKKPRSEGI